MQDPRRARWRGGRRRASPAQSVSSSSSQFANLLVASVTNFILSAPERGKVDNYYCPEVVGEQRERGRDVCGKPDVNNSSSSQFSNVLSASLAESVVFEPEHVEVEDWDIKHSPKWIELADGPFTKADQLCVDIRRLQQRCGCSDSTCDEIINTFSKYLSLDVQNFRSCDGKMQEMAGASVLRLNGCPECNCHVYLPDDKATTCPHVFAEGQRRGKARGDVCGHSRFDPKGKPWEVSFILYLHLKIVRVSLTAFICTHHLTASLLLPDPDKVKGAVTDQAIQTSHQP